MTTEEKAAEEYERRNHQIESKPIDIVEAFLAGIQWERERRRKKPPIKDISDMIKFKDDE